jgi:hypothetical protein
VTKYGNSLKEVNRKESSAERAWVLLSSMVSLSLYLVQSQRKLWSSNSKFRMTAASGKGGGTWGCGGLHRNFHCICYVFIKAGWWGHWNSLYYHLFCCLTKIFLNFCICIKYKNNSQISFTFHTLDSISSGSNRHGRSGFDFSNSRTLAGGFSACHLSLHSQILWHSGVDLSMMWTSKVESCISWGIIVDMAYTNWADLRGHPENPDWNHAVLYQGNEHSYKSKLPTDVFAPHVQKGQALACKFCKP